MNFWAKFAAAATACLWVSAPAVSTAIDMNLEVDARDVVHGIQHAHLTLPTHAGPLTLAYPRWIAGEHRPTGPITQVMNLTFSADGRPLAWRRDAADAFLFHLNVPSGTEALDIRFDFYSPSQATGPGFSGSPDWTPHLLILAFNQFLFYPVEPDSQEAQVTTRLWLPPHWRADRSLRMEPEPAGNLRLPPVTLSRLIDSPVVAGEYFSTWTASEGEHPVRLSVVGDDAEASGAAAVTLASLRRLVAQTGAVFGPPHYQSYVWLVALGDTLAHDGLEHFESADIRESASLFTDRGHAIEWRLFPHEYVHSWNGKYRRPAGLNTPDPAQAMDDEMLWMYEGLTRYYGDLVLNARSGLSGPTQSREYLAYIAALMARARPGRQWRSLADTAIAVPAYAGAPRAWESMRRGSDYYAEMLLIWLEVDVMLRERSRGRKSLDDFCRLFFKGPAADTEVHGYTRDDVIRGLRAVDDSDWNGYLAARIDAINQQAPLAGITQGGWDLLYGDTPNGFQQDLETLSATDDLSLSLGFWSRTDGTVLDVVPGSPAFLAGLTPGMHLQAINGARWTGAAVRAAIVAAKHTAPPLELGVADGALVRTLRLDYHEGLRYPLLRRRPNTKDWLQPIFQARQPGP